MGSSLRRSHRAWLLKVVGVLASCLAAGLVTASVVSGTNAIASLSTDTTTSDTTSAAPTAPSIRAEKDDYVPSEVVTLWATGWAPGEVVEVFVNDDEGRTWNHTGTATADELGAFMYEFALPDWFVATYQVTATGDSGSVATSSFADSVAVGTSNATSNGSAGLASQQITISAPAVSVGDVLIAQIVITDSITNTFICPNNPPGGWTTVLKNNRDDKILQETFWFRAAVAAPATSYTWQFKTTSCAGSLIGAGTKGASGGITRFAGVVATGNPYDVAVGANSSSSGPFTAPAATTTVADTRILRFFGVFKNTNITDPPAAPVVPRLYHVASSAAKERAAAAFDTGQQLAIGSTGPYTANVASGSEAAFQTVALTSAVLVASDAPVVSSPICAGATSVSGTSSEAVGTTIEVFKNGASVGTTTVLAGGSWTKGSLAALVAGDQITARATAVGETVSPDSAIVTVSACNAAPTTPADLAQFRTDATTPIALGGFTNETSAVLEGNLADPDANDMVKLEVEVKPVGTAFDTTGLVSGAFVTDPSTASVTVSGLSHGVAYHWRGRAVDDDGAASAWQSFGGGNPESAADFTVDTAKPTLTASATSPPAGPAYVAGTWTNQNVRVAFDCQDPVSGVAVDTVLDVTVSTDGADQSVTSAGSCTDVAGNTADAATFSNIDLDKTAPVDVETLLERSPDHNGWYNEPLGWETTGDDDTSGIASCSSGTYSGPDATGLSVSGFCTDLAGNSSAAVSSVLFDYDATAPVDVETLLGRGPDHNGWYNAPLDWETSGTDDTSGIASCDSGTYSTPDATGLTVSGACTDIAGNSSAAVSSVLFDYDATAPVDVETLLERDPDHNGWYNAPLDWETSGSDDTSGIDTCSSGTYSALDGTALTVSGSCTDAAGNSSDPVASDEFDYDATAPVDVETLLGRAPDHNGWYNAPLDWETSGTDDTSGIDSCDSGTHSTPDATGLTVSGACTDNAGNSSAAVASEEFDYDATAPVDVETLLGRAPDHNGWYNAPLDWETSGTDDTSGIDSCDSGTHSAPDGTGLTVSGSCTDAAGNSSAAVSSVLFDYDATAPVDVETLLGRAPDHNGWYNAPLDWETSGTDDTSGIDSCDSGTYSTPDATGLTVSGACTDNAGNSSAAVASEEFDYDATAPVDVETLLGRGPDHNGWYNAPLDWETSGTDDTSGIDSCDSGTYSTPDATGLTVSGACTDNAGNSSAAVASDEFDYDATAPVDVETLLGRGPDHNGWYNAPLDWETTGDDLTSGIDTCSSGTYSTPDDTAVTVSGFCTDNAGNSSAAVASDEFDYDATAPVDVETLLGRGPDHNGWYNAPLDWETSGTDDTSGIDSCDSGTYSTPDATGLTVSGACTDNAGNSSAAVASLAFDYDATDPVDVQTLLERGPDHGGWYNAPLDWETTGNDFTSGIDTCSSGTYSTPDDTAVTVSGFCTDNAGNSSDPVASEEFDYDNTDPQLSPVVTPNPVVLNGSATASPNATDNLSGVDSSSCDPVDTSAVGAHSVSCSATDNAGNSGTANAWYSVVFNFQGFFQPVDNGGVYNVVQAGRAIPVKFSLGGNQGLNILASGYPVSTKVECSGAAGTDVLEETMTSGSSGLQYDGTVNPPVGQYVYVWKTEKSWASTCRRLDVKLADGQTRSAFFSFKK